MPNLTLPAGPLYHYLLKQAFPCSWKNVPKQENNKTPLLRMQNEVILLCSSIFCAVKSMIRSELYLFQEATDRPACL